MSAVNELQTMSEIEIKTINDRIQMVDRHLDRALHKMEDIQHASTDAVHAAMTSLTEQVLAYYSGKKKKHKAAVDPRLTGIEVTRRDGT